MVAGGKKKLGILFLLEQICQLQDSYLRLDLRKEPEKGK